MPKSTDDKIEFYKQVRKIIGQPGTAVRCNGNTVEIYGLPFGMAKYVQWYFIGTVDEFY